MAINFGHTISFGCCHPCECKNYIIVTWFLLLQQQYQSQVKILVSQGQSTSFGMSFWFVQRLRLTTNKKFAIVFIRIIWFFHESGYWIGSYTTQLHFTAIILPDFVRVQMSLTKSHQQKTDTVIDWNILEHAVNEDFTMELLKSHSNW